MGDAPGSQYTNTLRSSTDDVIGKTVETSTSDSGADDAISLSSVPSNASSSKGSKMGTIAQSPSALVFRKQASYVAPVTSALGRFAGLQSIPSEAVQPRQWGTKVAPPPPPPFEPGEPEFSNLKLKRTDALPPRPYGTKAAATAPGDDSGMAGSLHPPPQLRSSMGSRTLPPTVIAGAIDPPATDESSIGSDSLGFSSSMPRPILTPVQRGVIPSPTPSKPSNSAGAGDYAAAKAIFRPKPTLNMPAPTVTPVTTTLPPLPSTTTTTSLKQATSAGTETETASLAPSLPSAVQPAATPPPPATEPKISVALRPQSDPPTNAPSASTAQNPPYGIVNLPPVTAPSTTTPAPASETTNTSSDLGANVGSVRASPTPPKIAIRATTTVGTSKSNTTQTNLPSNDSDGGSPVEAASVATIKASNPSPLGRALFSKPPLEPRTTTTTEIATQTACDVATQTSDVDSVSVAASIDDSTGGGGGGGDESGRVLGSTMMMMTMNRAILPTSNSHVDSMALGKMKNGTRAPASYLPAPMMQAGTKEDADGSYEEDDSVDSEDESWLSPSLRGERTLDPHAKAPASNKGTVTHTSTSTSTVIHSDNTKRNGDKPKHQKRPRSKEQQVNSSSRSRSAPDQQSVVVVNPRGARIDFTGAIMDTKNWSPPSHLAPSALGISSSTKATTKPKSALDDGGGDEDGADSNDEMDFTSLYDNSSIAATLRESFDASGQLIKSASERLRHGLDGPGETNESNDGPSYAWKRIEEIGSAASEEYDDDGEGESASSGGAIDESESQTEEHGWEDENYELEGIDEAPGRESSENQSMDASGMIFGPGQDILPQIVESYVESSESSSLYADTPLEDVVDRSRSVSLESPNIIPSTIKVHPYDDVEQARGRATPRTTTPRKVSSRVHPNTQTKPRSCACRCFVYFLLLLGAAGWGFLMWFFFFYDSGEVDPLGMNATLVPTADITPKPAPPTQMNQPTRFPTPSTPTPNGEGGNGDAPSSNIFAPTNNGTDVLLKMLTSVSSDGGASLQDPTSPQFNAMEWIRTPVNSGIYTDRRFLARYALATFYYSTHGEKWENSEQWLTQAHECDWFSYNADTPSCDEDMNIIEIDLSRNNLRGTLPPELTLLSLRKWCGGVGGRRRSLYLLRVLLVANTIVSFHPQRHWLFLETL
jgi:hypothetical protein